jgi:hypothetical protein
MAPKKKPDFDYESRWQQVIIAARIAKVGDQAE